MNSQDIRNLQEAYFDVYQNLDERVLGQDPESRKEDSKERKSGSKRLPPSSGEKYAKTQSQLISFIDKLTKNKKIIPGMSNEEVEEFDEVWKPVNVPRVKSRMGSLEQGIRQNVSSPYNTPEYARYQRTADVVAQSTSNPNKPFQKPTFDPGGLVKKPEGGITSSPERNPQWREFSSRLPYTATKPEKQVPGVIDKLKNQTANVVASPTVKSATSRTFGSSDLRPGRGSTSNWMTDRMKEFTSSLNRVSTPTKPTKITSRSTRGGSSSSAGAGSVSSISGGSSYDVGGQTSSRGFGLSGIKLANSYEPDLYDVILEYLLDEGYADTNENALVIMGNMSEDWRESIAENVTSGKSRVRNVQPKPTGPISNSERQSITQSRIDAENIRIKDAGDAAHAAATSKGLGFSDAQARRTAAELRLKREIAKSYR